MVPGAAVRDASRGHGRRDPAGPRPGDVGRRDQVAVAGPARSAGSEHPAARLGDSGRAGRAGRGGAPFVGQDQGDPGLPGLVAQHADQMADAPVAGPLAGAAAASSRTPRGSPTRAAAGTAPRCRRCGGGRRRRTTHRSSGAAPTGRRCVQFPKHPGPAAASSRHKAWYDTSGASWRARRHAFTSSTHAHTSPAETKPSQPPPLPPGQPQPRAGGAVHHRWGLWLTVSGHAAIPPAATDKTTTPPGRPAPHRRNARLDQNETPSVAQRRHRPLTINRPDH